MENCKKFKPNGANNCPAACKICLYSSANEQKKSESKKHIQKLIWKWWSNWELLYLFVLKLHWTSSIPNQAFNQDSKCGHPKLMHYRACSDEQHVRQHRTNETILFESGHPQCTFIHGSWYCYLNLDWMIYVEMNLQTSKTFHYYLQLNIHCNKEKGQLL